MNDYKQKMIANSMEPIFKKMKIGDRGIFDIDGKEYFIAKHMPKLTVGAYKDRNYILPIEYLNDIKTRLKREAGCQITAGYFGSHFTYIDPEHSAPNKKEKSGLEEEGKRMNVKMDKKEFLRMCLEEKNKLAIDGVKAWEFAIQEAIEKACPDKQWYEVTKVPIFTELLGGKMPVDICEIIWNDVAQELSLKKKDVMDSLDEKISKAVINKMDGPSKVIADKSR